MCVKNKFRKNHVILHSQCECFFFDDMFLGFFSLTELRLYWFIYCIDSFLLFLTVCRICFGDQSYEKKISVPERFVFLVVFNQHMAKKPAIFINFERKKKRSRASRLETHNTKLSKITKNRKSSNFVRVFITAKKKCLQLFRGHFERARTMTTIA